jgi:hypothetical protein
MRYTRVFSKEEQSRGGFSQVGNIYQCEHCQEIGLGNKMVYHMKACDGTGFKNYWSKKRSDKLKALMFSLPSIF